MLKLINEIIAAMLIAFGIYCTIEEIWQVCVRKAESRRLKRKTLSDAETAPTLEKEIDMEGEKKYNKEE